MAILLLFLLPVRTQPYPYKQAVGARAGYSSGINYKRFVPYGAVTDFYALYHPDGFQVSGFFSYQFSPHFKNRLQYYAGAGAFGGNWENELSAGPSILLGAEFIFREVPLALGLQWKPMLNAWKVFDYAWYDFGLSILVTLD